MSEMALTLLVVLTFWGGGVQELVCEHGAVPAAPGAQCGAGLQLPA